MKSGFLWGIAGRVSLTIVSTLSSAALARLLTPYDFGVASAATVFVVVAQRVTSLGFNAAIIQVPKLRDDHLSTVFAINAALGIGVGLLLAALASPFGAFFQSPDAARAIPVAALAFGIGALGAAPAALISRNLRFRQLVAIDTANGWLTAASSVILAFWGLGYWSLIYSMLIGSVFDSVVKLSLARWRPKLRMTRAALGELFSVGSGLYLKRLLDSLAQYIDNLIIGRTLGLTVLGVYDRAFTNMNRAVSLISYAGPTVSFSVLARVQEDQERFRQAFRRLTVGIGITCYPTFVFLGMCARPIFLILFGAQWEAAIAPFQVLCATGALKSLTVYVSSAVQAKGRVWAEVWRQGVYLSLIVAGVVVGSRWGLVGASFGVLFATGVMAVLMADLLRRVADLSWADLAVPHRAGLSCAAVVASSIVVARWAYTEALGSQPNAATQVVLEGTVGALGALAFLLLCPFADGRQVVRETLSDFAPRVGRRLGVLTAQD